MRFADAHLLWLLTALPILLLAGAWTLRRRRLALERFAGGSAAADRFRAEVDPHRRAIKRILTFLALAAAIVALARPQWSTRLEEVEREGADVVVMLDHSLSMTVTDVAPDRLRLAKHHIEGLLDRLGGDRVAFVHFAGTASMAVPLTIDHAAVELFLETVDADAVPIAGTSLAEAFEVALAAFPDREVGSGRNRAIVLFTDGEDHEGGLEEVVESLVDEEVTVLAVGCGTQRGGAIPVGSGYKTDAEGKIVTSRLDEAFLESLARSTQGQYHRATTRGAELDRIADAIGGLDRQAFGATLRARFEERFQLPLLLALLALLVESLLGDRRRVQNRREVRG